MQHFTNKNSFIQKYICRICSLSVHPVPVLQICFAVLSCPAVSSGASCPCAIFSYVWLRAYIHASAQACVCMQCVWCGVCRAGACVYIHIILWKWPRLCVSETCVHARECPSEHIVFVQCLCSESVSMYVCTDFMHSCTWLCWQSFQIFAFQVGRYIDTYYVYPCLLVSGSMHVHVCVCAHALVRVCSNMFKCIHWHTCLQVEPRYSPLSEGTNSCCGCSRSQSLWSSRCHSRQGWQQNACTPFVNQNSHYKRGAFGLRFQSISKCSLKMIPCQVTMPRKSVSHLVFSTPTEWCECPGLAFKVKGLGFSNRILALLHTAAFVNSLKSQSWLLGPPWLGYKPRIATVNTTDGHPIDSIDNVFCLPFVAKQPDLLLEQNSKLCFPQISLRFCDNPAAESVAFTAFTVPSPCASPGFWKWDVTTESQCLCFVCSKSARDVKVWKQSFWDLGRLVGWWLCYVFLTGTFGLTDCIWCQSNVRSLIMKICAPCQSKALHWEPVSYDYSDLLCFCTLLLSI